MKIELRQSNPNRSPIYTELYVNGIKLGEYLGGKDKKYLNPEKWAKEQIKKRNKVINRNIKRLKNELRRWEEEKRIINDLEDKQ